MPQKRQITAIERKKIVQICNVRAADGSARHDKPVRPGKSNERGCRDMFCHFNSSARSPTSSKKAASLAIGWLPARPNPQPVESQRFILGVPQPFRDFLCLECAIPRVQFMIEQLGNFFDRARFPDSVQSSRDVLVERASRIGSLRHFTCPSRPKRRVCLMIFLPGLELRYSASSWLSHKGCGYGSCPQTE